MKEAPEETATTRRVSNRLMDPTWGWFEWVWCLGSLGLPGVLVGRWLIPRLKARQWWALLVAPFAYVLLWAPMFMMCCKPYYGARAAGLITECQSRLGALTRATYYFTSGNADRMPLAPTWQSDVAPFLKTTPGSIAFRCPSNGPRGDYVFNVNLSGVELSKIDFPAETVLFFEGNGAANFGGEELIASRLRHGGTLWVVTVDGATHRYRAGGPKKFRWTIGSTEEKPAQFRPIARLFQGVRCMWRSPGGGV